MNEALNTPLRGGSGRNRAPALAGAACVGPGCSGNPERSVGRIGAHRRAGRSVPFPPWREVPPAPAGPRRSRRPVRGASRNRASPSGRAMNCGRAAATPLQPASPPMPSLRSRTRTIRLRKPTDPARSIRGTIRSTGSPKPRSRNPWSTLRMTSMATGPRKAGARKEMLALGAVAGAVLLGLGGAFVCNGGGSALMSGEPPLITAKNEPTKIQPQTPAGSKFPIRTSRSTSAPRTRLRPKS